MTTSSPSSSRVTPYIQSYTTLKHYRSAALKFKKQKVVQPDVDAWTNAVMTAARYSRKQQRQQQPTATSTIAAADVVIEPARIAFAVSDIIATADYIRQSVNRKRKRGDNVTVDSVYNELVIQRVEQQQQQQQQQPSPLPPPSVVLSPPLQIEKKARFVTSLLLAQIRQQCIELCELRQQIVKEQSRSQVIQSELEQQRIVADQAEQTLQVTQQTACVLLISNAVKHFLFRSPKYQDTASIEASAAVDLYNVVIDVQQIMCKQQQSSDIDGMLMTPHTVNKAQVLRAFRCFSLWIHPDKLMQVTYIDELYRTEMFKVMEAVRLRLIQLICMREACKELLHHEHRPTRLDQDANQHYIHISQEVAQWFLDQYFLLLGHFPSSSMSYPADMMLFCNSTLSIDRIEQRKANFISIVHLVMSDDQSNSLVKIISACSDRLIQILNDDKSNRVRDYNGEPLSSSPIRRPFEHDVHNDSIHYDSFNYRNNSNYHSIPSYYSTTRHDNRYYHRNSRTAR